MKLCKTCGKPDGEVKFSKEYTTICNSCRGKDFRGMDGSAQHRESILKLYPVRKLSQEEIAAEQYEPPVKNNKQKVYPGRY